MSRINAAVAVACLCGHIEGNPRLQLEEKTVIEILDVLDCACMGGMKHGIFWTVWKLCQGLASLTVNDNNKEMIAANGGVEVLSEVRPLCRRMVSAHCLSTGTPPPPTQARLVSVMLVIIIIIIRRSGINPIPPTVIDRD